MLPMLLEEKLVADVPLVPNSAVTVVWP